MTTFTIGRSQGDPAINADILIPGSDNGVSRRHAEITISKDGRLYLSDCGSSFGTFVKKPGKDWGRIQQTYLEPTDQVRFGAAEMSCTRLSGMIPNPSQPATPPSTPPGTDDREVYRDLESGSIRIRKK